MLSLGSFAGVSVWDRASGSGFAALAAHKFLHAVHAQVHVRSEKAAPIQPKIDFTSRGEGRLDLGFGAERKQQGLGKMDSGQRSWPALRACGELRPAEAIKARHAGALQMNTLLQGLHGLAKYLESPPLYAFSHGPAGSYEAHAYAPGRMSDGLLDHVVDDRRRWLLADRCHYGTY